MTVEKKSVSFEETIFDELEKRRNEIGMSRSGFIDFVLRAHFGLTEEPALENVFSNAEKDFCTLR
jgi:metal-responsive CopG/Arc/MetJ family transcriptional regulator